MSDTVQLSDQYLIASSLKTEPDVRISKSKTVVEVPDANAGSYASGLITVGDSTILNGSHGFASLREAYLTVPYVITARNITSGDVPLGGVMNRFCCTLKTGIWNIISDLQVELNSKQILTSNEYKSFWNNLRSMTETSQSEMKKHQAETFLYPDDWYSINFSSSASSAGDGYSNNQCDILSFADSTLGQTQENRPCNRGLVEKINNIGDVYDTTTNKPRSWATGGAGTSGASMIKQAGRSFFIEKTTAAKGADAGIWVYVLKIRLTDLHPIFKDLDLIANPQLKIQYRINTGTTSIQATRSGAGTAADPHITSMSLLGTTMTSGTVCPIMITSGAAGQPMAVVGGDGAARDISFSFGVLQNAFTSKGELDSFLPYNTTQLQVPFYDITDPRAIISKPVKQIRYLDCYAQYIQNQLGLGVQSTQFNSTFNFQLPSTHKNIKYVAVLPFANTKSGHFASSNVAGLEQFQSPFDSAPWTVCPGALIKNFQVRLGNKNVFAKTQDYDYECFTHEFSKLGALNGDLTTEMNSGIIDFNQWSYAQRILVADCSRYTDKDVPVSVQISGTNNCCQGLNLLAFIVYERDLSIDRITGEVVEFSL